MDDIFRQLGVLFLGSIPTMVIFLLLLFCYTVLVHRPLQRLLAVRRERTAGAVEKANAAIAMAEGKAQEYEDRLRAARLEINQAREKQIAGWNASRDQALTEARAEASAQLRGARATLEADAERFRASMEGSIDTLAGEILSTVLPARSGVQAGSPLAGSTSGARGQEVRS